MRFDTHIYDISIIRYIGTRCYVSDEYVVKFIKRNISDVRVTFSLRVTVRSVSIDDSDYFDSPIYS